LLGDSTLEDEIFFFQRNGTVLWDQRESGLYIMAVTDAEWLSDFTPEFSYLYDERFLSSSIDLAI